MTDEIFTTPTCASREIYRASEPASERTIHLYEDDATLKMVLQDINSYSEQTEDSFDDGDCEVEQEVSVSRYQLCRVLGLLRGDAYLHLQDVIERRFGNHDGLDRFVDFCMQNRLQWSYYSC